MFFCPMFSWSLCILYHNNNNIIIIPVATHRQIPSMLYKFDHILKFSPSHIECLHTNFKILNKD
jgi:hypothetical protein